MPGRNAQNFPALILHQLVMQFGHSSILLADMVAYTPQVRADLRFQPRRFGELSFERRYWGAVSISAIRLLV
jgi:hypothetical protein